MTFILVAEDDIFLSEMLCDLLRQQGFAPIPAYSGSEALLLLSKENFSLVLLDLMLPGKTGDQVLAETRKESSVPVIVLTAMADKETTVRLLQSGADDYIAKPFDNNELLARIDVQLRRGVQNQPKQIQYKSVTIDLEGYDALSGGKKAGLSKREFEILRLMMSYPNKVFSKNNLYESIWGGEFLGDDNTVNVHISKLRAKLHAISPDIDYIQTVWGIGFKMRE